MLTVILIFCIFNTGLIILMSGTLLYAIRKEMVEVANTVGKHIEAHVDGSIESATTAIYNMDSLKAKVNMSGRVEV